jgi:hypothetical protein
VGSLYSIITATVHDVTLVVGTAVTVNSPVLEFTDIVQPVPEVTLVSEVVVPTGLIRYVLLANVAVVLNVASTLPMYTIAPVLKRFLVAAVTVIMECLLLLILLTVSY